MINEHYIFQIFRGGSKSPAFTSNRAVCSPFMLSKWFCSGSSKQSPYDTACSSYLNWIVPPKKCLLKFLVRLILATTPVTLIKDPSLLFVYSNHCNSSTVILSKIVDCQFSAVMSEFLKWVPTVPQLNPMQHTYVSTIHLNPNLNQLNPSCPWTIYTCILSVPLCNRTYLF